ncbi:hypothetical protein FDP41_002673 [Naegleria fowleri]|uniref:Zn(2)-C6 fungal-type domain-containing protein n=1 Tax=Naegleria fowleri TaxID=5763 RepID=A0A6A5BWB6_NAEFO|nr:uncharacterized protein FDP41_002673 [Naegleria fowleri]KAF0978158.1 hypothetical protein FDP41_002673 [Naegleria fowleri]CAG4712190.1 unnamed protein product [Naegleria fowleri]
MATNTTNKESSQQPQPQQQLEQQSSHYWNPCTTTTTLQHHTNEDSSRVLKVFNNACTSQQHCEHVAQKELHSDMSSLFSVNNNNNHSMKEFPLSQSPPQPPQPPQPQELTLTDVFFPPFTLETSSADNHVRENWKINTHVSGHESSLSEIERSGHQSCVPLSTTISTHVNTFEKQLKNNNEKDDQLLEEGKLTTPIIESDANFNPISCITCRRGHKRCGRQLPSCHECISKGKVCDYPAAKKRGRTVGSKNKIQKKKPVTISVLGLDSFEKGKQNNKCVQVTLLTPQPLTPSSSTAATTQISNTYSQNKNQQYSSVTTIPLMTSDSQSIQGHVKKRTRKANLLPNGPPSTIIITTTPTPPITNTTFIQEHATLTLHPLTRVDQSSNSTTTTTTTTTMTPAMSLPQSSHRKPPPVQPPLDLSSQNNHNFQINESNLSSSMVSTITNGVSTVPIMTCKTTLLQNIEKRDEMNQKASPQVLNVHHDQYLLSSDSKENTTTPSMNTPSMNASSFHSFICERQEMSNSIFGKTDTFVNSSNRIQEDSNDQTNQAPVNSERSTTLSQRSTISTPSQSLTIENILQLFQMAIQNHADPSVLHHLWPLILKQGNTSEVMMPFLQQHGSQFSTSTIQHSTTTNMMNLNTSTITTPTVGNFPNQTIQHSLQLPQVIDEAVYDTFERNAVLSQVVLQQQTVDLFFGVVTAGVSIIPQSKFQNILAEKESYGTSTQYFALLYAIQCFCYQRFGNNENAIRSFQRSKELLFSEYHDLDQPSYLMAAICCYLASYAAASSMDQDATELVAITKTYLSQIKDLDDALICLKRACILATFITHDFDYEHIGVSHYIQRKLLEGYQYSSGSNFVPEELLSILKQPLTKETLPRYLYFVDKIYECYSKYDSTKKNVAEKGKILSHLIISIALVSYRLGILRELGLRGRELRSVTEELTRLSSHPLFGYIPPFLLSGIAIGWKSHAEAIEEIENEIQKENCNQHLRQELIYYHDMLERDLLSASLMGKRFVKVFRGFGHIVQRMIDCARRKALMKVGEEEGNTCSIMTANSDSSSTTLTPSLNLTLESFQNMFRQFNQ